MATRFKVFCVLCPWETVVATDDTLWMEHAKCPQCLGATDAMRLDRPKFLPPSGTTK